MGNGSQNTEKHQIFAILSNCGQIAYTSNLTIEAKYGASWFHSGASPHDPAFLREHHNCLISKLQGLPINQYRLKIRRCHAKDPAEGVNQMLRFGGLTEQE